MTDFCSLEFVSTVMERIEFFSTEIKWDSGLCKVNIFLISWITDYWIIIKSFWTSPQLVVIQFHRTELIRFSLNALPWNYQIHDMLRF
jgi:hypothetical protein